MSEEQQAYRAPVSAQLEWRANHWVVVVSSDDVTIEVPLDEWLHLPAVRYGAELLVEKGCIPTGGAEAPPSPSRGN